jgi:hypothetical protein
MRTTYNKTTMLLTAIATLTLSACGGGGGGTSLGIPTTGVSLTATNAKPVSAEVLNSTNTVQNATAGTTIIPGVSISTQAGHFNYADFIVKKLTQTIESKALIDSIATGVAVQTQLNCATSGNFTVSGTVADQDYLTADDSLTYRFNNCNTDGTVINGSMSLSVNSVSDFYTGDAPYTLDIDVVMTRLSVNDSGIIYTSNGDISMRLDVDASGNETAQRSSTSLSSTAAAGGVILSNYQNDLTYASNADFTASMQGTIASTKIDGAVSFTTLTALTGNDNIYNGYPTAGEMHITTTADSSQAWVTALSDGVNVQIDLDLDGDDSVDDTVMTTWTELESL